MDESMNIAISLLAKALNTDTEKAKELLSKAVKEYVHPGPMQIQFEAVEELKKDRDRLKAALTETLCTMVIYSDDRGSEAIRNKIDICRKRAGEALRLSDMLESPKPVKIIAFKLGGHHE